jgi:type IV pilus assembly protein PilM
MAAPGRIITLNLGMQTIGLAEFKTSPSGGLTLVNFNLTELLADPSAEGTRIPQMRVALREKISLLKAGGAKVNYSISSQSVFTRFVKLPPVDADKIDQIIAFEAQQNVPFPIDEVVWGYQLVGAPEASRVEVVLVAIKADLLNDLNGAVEDAGLTTDTVDVAPLALYNAFRYNYSDQNGCSLLIDIGARTTNLIFIEPHKVFSRSIPIGGTTITASLAKEFSEPFGASEDRKRGSGFISLGGNYAEPSDPDLARLSKTARSTMARLHAEIARSISFYRMQQAGAVPQRVFICGGGSSLPYTREFFQEKLQIPVEYFNPLRNVTVAPGVNVEDAGRSAHVMGELVGLGLRSIGSCPMELNLRPASVVAATRLAKQRPYLVAAGICFLLCLAGWGLYFNSATRTMTAVLEKLKPAVAGLQAVETKFNAIKKEREQADQNGALFVNAVHDREYWVRLINELNQRLPGRYVWITRLVPANFAADGSAALLFGDDSRESAPPAPAAGVPGKETKTAFGVQVQGLYLQNDGGPAVFDEFVENLKNSPIVSKVAVLDRATPTEEELAYPYKINIELKEGMKAQ